ncbi:hypothetical protein BDQ12DRAFT_720215 [Crucibulum laeve]|uniref:Uncharacterized protein n=1 Tax=Crucibulum laeve TaxID=68775 RepID=A0A5C3MBF0_9AGAR|nr:hypothetical protein BDQ12DRAFT_720215 [Crucibulum laeve]
MTTRKLSFQPSPLILRLGTFHRTHTLTHTSTVDQPILFHDTTQHFPKTCKLTTPCDVPLLPPSVLPRFLHGFNGLRQLKNSALEKTLSPF